MKNIVLLFAVALYSFSAAAADSLNDGDTGTYVVLDKNRNPTEMFYRLSQSDGKWVMDGKKPGGGWANISCDTGCEYRDSTEGEIQTYFPPDWRANTSISCIQNMAQAFCRYSVKEDSTKRGYVVIALVTGRPIPIFVRRVPS